MIQVGKAIHLNQIIVYFSQFAQIRSGNYYFVFFIAAHAKKMRTYCQLTVQT